jgi:hypothetical protein
MWRQLRRRKDFLQFDRHVQDDHGLCMGLELPDLGPKADQQERVSDFQPLLRQVARDDLVAVPQSDDGEAVLGAKPGLAHGLADQRGFGRQDDLRRADLLRAIGKVAADIAER